MNGAENNVIQIVNALSKQHPSLLVKVKIKDNWPNSEHKLRYGPGHEFSIYAIEEVEEDYWDYMDEKNSPKKRQICLITLQSIPIGG